MSVGVVELPLRMSPAPPAIVILERPLLKVELEEPTRNFFWIFWSLEAAIKAKSRKSPFCGLPPPVTVRLNWVGVPQLRGLPEVGLHKVPGMEEPVTTHCPPE